MPVILDENSDGSFVYYGNGPGIDNKLWYIQGGSSPVFFLTDNLGSTRALVSSSGSIISGTQIDYDSFGKPSISLPTRFQYTGREYDADTELYYYRARWYDPAARRFISEDPIGLNGGINLYAYVNNNPIMLIDPLGLWGEDVHLERTMTWAMLVPGIGPTIAERIARADNNTDRFSEGTGPWGAATGDSSRHFDYNPNSGDSRLEHANRDLSSAVELMRKGKCAAAYDRLGRGLHSVQDYYAHRNWDPSLKYGPDWNAHPSWYDNVEDPRNRIPLKMTAKHTIMYIQSFQDAIQRNNKR